MTQRDEQIAQVNFMLERYTKLHDGLLQAGTDYQAVLTGMVHALAHLIGRAVSADDRANLKEAVVRDLKSGLVEGYNQAMTRNEGEPDVDALDAQANAPSTTRVQ